MDFQCSENGLQDNETAFLPEYIRRGHGRKPACI
jgi:hypothetical protein